jgi:hypothetical protein
LKDIPLRSGEPCSPMAATRLFPCNFTHQYSGNFSQGSILGTVGMWNARGMVSWRLPPRFQDKKPWRPGIVWHGQYLWRQPMRRQCGNLWRWRLSCNGEAGMFELAGMWNVFQGKLQAMSGVSRKERPCGLQMQGHNGRAFPTCWSSHHTIIVCFRYQTWATWLNVCLVGFWSFFNLIFPCYSLLSPSWNRNFTLCYCVLEVCNFKSFSFFGGSHLRVCLES